MGKEGPPFGSPQLWNVSPGYAPPYLLHYPALGRQSVSLPAGPLTNLPSDAPRGRKEGKRNKPREQAEATLGTLQGQRYLTSPSKAGPAEPRLETFPMQCDWVRGVPAAPSPHTHFPS